MPLTTVPSASAAAAASGARRRQITGSVTAPITKLSTIVPPPLAGSSVIPMPIAVNPMAMAQSSHARGTGVMAAIVTPCDAPGIILRGEPRLPPRDDVGAAAAR